MIGVQALKILKIFAYMYVNQKGYLYSYKGSDIATMSHDDIQLMYAAGRQINEKGNAPI